MDAKHREAKREIIAAYDHALVRAYCTIRFLIINMRILEELEQYIAPTGKTLDVGCGFGLFSLFFARMGEGREVFGFDLNGKRIDLAESARAKLGLDGRVEFKRMNVLDFDADDTFSSAIVLDLLHHIPAPAVDPLLAKLYRLIAPGGTLVVKDIDASSPLKTAFTWLLDKAMDYKTPVSYSRRGEMADRLRGHGFDVKVHQMVDLLPYPHVLYVCKKAEKAAP